MPFQTCDNKTTKQLALAVLTVLTLGLGGCAKSSDDGKWASEEIPDPVESPTDPTVTPMPTPTPPRVPNATPTPTPTPGPGQDWPSFSMGTEIYQLAHGPGQTWLGCATKAYVKGGYDSNTVCGNSALHPAFAKQLNTYFMNCVDEGAKAAGLRVPERVFVRHWGSYANRNARNSTRLSLHAYARALDIQNFLLYDAAGTLVNISTHINDYAGTTAKFYDGFRQCWRETMPSSCGPGQTEYEGSIGHTKSAMGGNSLHYNHIHLSLPLCAGG
jgi:hypothetical protein